MDMLYGFWVYVSWPHDYARVHKAECGHCQGGMGKTRQALTQSGRWIGPYASRAEAMAAGRRTGRAKLDECSCMVWSRIFERAA